MRATRQQVLYILHASRTGVIYSQMPTLFMRRDSRRNPSSLRIFPSTRLVYPCSSTARTASRPILVEGSNAFGVRRDIEQRVGERLGRL
jgi:hypothetical protein